MPAPMGASSISSPACRCATKASTSWLANSVKTAMRESGPGSEREQLPHPLAADPLGLLRHVAALGRHDLIRLHARRLGRHGDALQLTAHAQLFDAHLVVFDHGALDRGFGARG